MTSDPCNEENRLKQLSINCAWLMEQFDGLQDTLGLDSVATWQDRATAVVRVVRIMAQEQNYLKEAVGKHLREMDQLMRQSSSYERGRRVAQSISALESALDAVKAHNLDKLGCLSVKADKAKVAKAKAPRIKK